jgi:hypothetical protein
MDGSSSHTHSHERGRMHTCLQLKQYLRSCTIPIQQHPGREPTSHTSLKPKPSSPASAAAAPAQEIQEKQIKQEPPPGFSWPKSKTRAATLQ